MGETKTSVQFVLMSLAIAFEMKPKQAFALLTNNHKYLMHLCVKGGKGADFEKVINWYSVVYPHVPHLIHLIVTEKKDLLSYGNPFNAIGSTAGNAREN